MRQCSKCFLSNVEQWTFLLYSGPGGEDCSALLVLAAALDDDMPPQQLLSLLRPGACALWNWSTKSYRLHKQSIAEVCRKKKTKNLSCLCHALRANLSNNFQTDQRNSINSTLAVPITLSANRIRHRFIQSTSSSGTNKTNIMLGDVQSRFMRMDMIKTDWGFQMLSGAFWFQDSPQKGWKRWGNKAAFSWRRHG